MNMNNYETILPAMQYSMPPLLFEPKIFLTDYLITSPERKHFEKCDYFSMQVSDDFAGAFIGKSGSNITKLRKKYQSKILVSNENGKRFVYISNSPDKMKIIGKLLYLGYLKN